MQRSAWIWLAGCIAWAVDGLLHVRLHAYPHARLAFLMAALFFVAWMFYRAQPKR